MKNNRTSSLSVGIKSASSEGGSEESGSQSTQGGGQGQGGEKRRPVNISFLSYFFFFFLQETSFLSSWVWSLWWVPVAVSACTVATIWKSHWQSTWQGLLQDHPCHYSVRGVLGENPSFPLAQAGWGDPHTDKACNKVGLLCRGIIQLYPRGFGRPTPNWKELLGIAKGTEVREREKGRGRGWRDGQTAI